MRRDWPELQLAWIEREHSAARWLHRGAARPGLGPLLTLASRLGDGWLWAAVIVALPWLAGSTGTACAVRMVAVLLVNLLIYFIVKRWIARPRPARSCPGIRECTRPLDEYSFPSGHTLHAVAFSVILGAYFPGCRPLVWSFTALIALSRVVLGLHYPSDVLVAAAIGAATAGVSFNLL